MKILCYGIIFCAGLFVACQKTILPDMATHTESTIVQSLTTYLIRKGNHYCDESKYQLIHTDIIMATVRFDSSASYSSLDPLNQGDVNKLVGFSDCGTDHQQNSARLGWSWNGNKVVLYAYAYVNSARIIKTLGSVNPGKSFSCSVSIKRGYYYFTLNNHTDSIAAHCSGFTGDRYKLFPYFGGDETAPHDIRIDLTEE